MKEEIIKIYDEMYNQIGAKPQSVVHEKGLLHQVVHLWMYEKIDGEMWIYFRQRSNDKIFPGLYDLICSGHMDPDETFEESIIYHVENELGYQMDKHDLKHIGNLRQLIELKDYHDNAFCQIYAVPVHNPVFNVGANVAQILRAKESDFEHWMESDEEYLPIYSAAGEAIGEASKAQWRLRNEEFSTIVKKYLHKVM